jgi:integrase
MSRIPRNRGALLGAHRRRQLEERLGWGEAWTDTGFVSTRKDGTAIHADNVSSRLAMLIRPAGLPRIRVHDLRHTHGTLGLAAEVPLKVMSERLCQATTQITADLYQHVIQGMGADAAVKIAALLRQSQ